MVGRDEAGDADCGASDPEVGEELLLEPFEPTVVLPASLNLVPASSSAAESRLVLPNPS